MATKTMGTLKFIHLSMTDLMADCMLKTNCLNRGLYVKILH